MDEDRGARLVLLGLALEVLEGHAEVVPAAVDELHVRARADRGERRRHEGVRRAEDGLALARPANSSAASAPPAQLERPTLGSLFHCAQRSSKAASLAPSDHCSESSTSVHSSKRRGRSRWSNPIANLVTSGRDVSAAPTVAPSVAGNGVCGNGFGGNRMRLVAESGARLPANPEGTFRSGFADPPGRPDRLRIGDFSPRRERTRSPRRPPASRPARPPRRATRRTATTRAAPPPGVPDQDSSKISGARITGTTTWTANITGATRVAGRRPRALISLSSAIPSEAAAVASQIAATSSEPGREFVGEELRGDRRPGVAEAGRDDRQRPRRARAARAPRKGRATGIVTSARAIAIGTAPAFEVVRSGAAQAIPATPTTIAATAPYSRRPGRLPQPASPRARAAAPARWRGTAGPRSAAPSAARRSPAASRAARSASPPASAGCGSAARSATPAARARAPPPAPPAPAARSRCCRAPRPRSRR